jgi:hypothetical protein
MNQLVRDDVVSELKARQAASESLLDFVQYTMPEYEVGDHHRLICEHLEAVERGDLDRLICLAPPRHGKSELVSRRFPAWWLGKRPTDQIIHASYGSELASDVGRDVRRILSGDLYHNVFSTELSPESRAADRWNTTAGGRYFAAGVLGGITGRGANLAVVDDPIRSRAEADSETTRESIWRWFQSTFFTRLMPGGAIVLVETFWHEDDLAGRLMNESDEWTVLRLPALNEDGQALWPAWYPEDSLQRIKSSVGPREWSALYMAQPQPEQGTYFERDWLRRFTDRPQQLNFYIGWDAAVSDGKGDYSAILVAGIDTDDNMFICDAWTGRKTLDVVIDALLDMVSKIPPAAHGRRKRSD